MLLGASFPIGITLPLGWPLGILIRLSEYVPFGCDSVPVGVTPSLLGVTIPMCLLLCPSGYIYVHNILP